MMRPLLPMALAIAILAGLDAVHRWRRRTTMHRAAVAEPESRLARQAPPLQRRDEAGPASAFGTVILPFGRYFAGRADLLTHDGFKTMMPIDGISPFTAVDDPDPDMAHFAAAPRVNDRVTSDVRKDFATRLAQSDADYLVVDNTTALLPHHAVNGRLYVGIPGEATDLADMLNGDDATRVDDHRFHVSRTGLTDDLRSRYDAFVDACLATFDPSRIILIRSHSPRFWLADDSTVAPTDTNRDDARLLEDLDDYFVARTGCQVSHAVLGHFPSAAKWQSYDHTQRRMLESDLVELCTSGLASAPPRRHAPDRPFVRRKMSAADHVVGAFRRQRHVNDDWLREYFTGGGASYDDLLALVFLKQTDPSHAELVTDCVKRAVTDESSYLLAETKRHVDRSLHALRTWQWCVPELPSAGVWVPQIAFTCGRFVFRFFADGAIDTFATSLVSASEARDIVDGRQPLTPLNLEAAIGSWPMYFERGRRRLTMAPRVVVPNTAALIDTCYWLDWTWVFANERVLITTADAPQPSPDLGATSRTDLSFIFDPEVRICTVGGGLMDQVTHVALFNELCSPHGLDYYLDDFRYTWWRSHNGFEASRLAPELERRRMTRQVSHALVESFRDGVLTTRLPWLFNQSRFWHESGLSEAMVVTRDYPNARRLMDIGPEFPVTVYRSWAEIVDYIKAPPRPVTFFTTQHRVPIAPESADPIRQVFSYHHLEADGLPSAVEQAAATLRAAPHVGIHVRRGDYLKSHFDTDGWHSGYRHYADAIAHVIDAEFGTSDINVAVFSDDLDFVEANEAAYGLDRVTGVVRYIRGNSHYKSIFDSYLMSLCPVIVGSVGFFAATTSLLADPPTVFIRARPEGVRVEWRRET